MTITLEDVARAALSGDGLRTRSLMQDWLAGRPDITAMAPPFSNDPMIRSLTAAFAEMMAQRLGQNPPPWAAAIGSAPHPTYLLKAALRMKRLRAECEQFSPPPLLRRHFYAPANYLDAI